MQMSLKSLINHRKSALEKRRENALSGITNSLCPQHEHGAVTTVLPQRVQEGDGGAVQEGRAPVPLLLLGVNQL